MRRRHVAVGLAALAAAALLSFPRSEPASRTPARARTAPAAPSAPPDAAAARAASLLGRFAPPIAALPSADGKGWGLQDGPVSARFTGDGFQLALRKTGAGPERVGWRVSGARPTEPRPEGPLETRVHWFVGDRTAWKTNLPSYSRLTYPEIRPGVQLVLEARPHGLKYTLLLAPGADAGSLGLEYAGAREIRVAEDGASLEVLTGSGALQESGLDCWQDAPEGRRNVSARYVPAGPAAYAIRLGAHDPGLPLVVDPVITWGSFIGGALDSSSFDVATCVAVNGLGEAYVAGHTSATDFPVSGAVQATLRAGNDVFVSKLDAAGTALLWSTYLGGDNSDSVSGIAVSGNLVYLTGQTQSTDFPTTPGAFNTTRSGVTDAYVSVLDDTVLPLTLAASTFLGGNAQDTGTAIAVDGSGIYVGGWTFSTNFPVQPGGNLYPRAAGFSGWVSKLNLAATALVWSGYTGAHQVWSIAVDAAQSVYIGGETSVNVLPFTGAGFDATMNGFIDAYVAKINPAGSAYVWSTFLGGDGFEAARGIAIDAALNVYVAGPTSSANLPVTAGSFQTTLGGFGDAFVAKISSTGAALTYATFLGGGDQEEAWDLVVDGLNQATVVGFTRSTVPDPFPTTIGALDRSFNGGSGGTDGFVTKLNAAGTGLVYSTYFGGARDEQILAIAQDAGGNVYLAGDTNSTTNNAPFFPTTPGAYDGTLGGLQDGFVAKLDAAGGALSYCTYIGGDTKPSMDSATSIAVGPAGAVVVAGWTSSLADSFDPSAFPADPLAFSPQIRGGSDAFIAKVDPGGAALLWCTYLGGSGDDQARDVAVDSAGDVYVVGETQSTDFTVSSGFQTALLGLSDGFAAKIDGAGQLQWSTYLGGSSDDAIGGVAVDSDRMVYVTGSSTSADFPSTAGPFGVVSANRAFVTKIHRTGASRVWSTILGEGTARAVGLDALGSVYVAGSTDSTLFPVTAGAFQTALLGFENGFVSKLPPSGDSLTWSTFLGGTTFEIVAGLVVEPGGACYVTGLTASADYPVTPGAYDTVWAGGGAFFFGDGFVTKLAPGGGALAWSTFLGGNGLDLGFRLATDSAGNVLVAGQTQAPDFPATLSGMDTTLDGPSDGFVAKLHATGSQLLWASYLGGSLDDAAADVAVDPAGVVYVAGETASVGFPTTGGVFDPVFSGTTEGFVLRISNPAPGAIAAVDLGQFLSDGATALAVGATTDELRVVLSALVADPEGDQVRLQLEVRPVGAAFTGTPNAEGEIVESGTIARVEVRGLSAGTSYHWQARVIDPGGQTSAWTSFGGNLDAPLPAAADFVVSPTAGAPPAAPAVGSSSSGGCGLSGIDLLLPVLLLSALRRRRKIV